MTYTDLKTGMRVKRLTHNDIFTIVDIRKYSITHTHSITGKKIAPVTKDNTDIIVRFDDEPLTYEFELSACNYHIGQFEILSY